ncbi:hypothetical protein [Nostoc sp. JL33]|uniref:hypothetical protein n=1 Tax=Nostoc sp. JL33 TaxID=2815396 RepID=UPI0026001D99|nr:hypothetical protein [Nostoc sp. JL33]MBN3872887.1 hypothetical protein [Nostoc sp. JL33]
MQYLHSAIAIAPNSCCAASTPVVDIAACIKIYKLHLTTYLFSELREANITFPGTA